jgi:hypothetical protein
MRRMRWSWILLLSSWAAPASAEVCVVQVTVQGSSCTLVKAPAEDECTSYEYRVSTDHPVKLHTPAGPTPIECASSPCTVTSSDTQAVPALRVQTGDGPLVDCMARPARQPRPPAAKPASNASRGFAIDAKDLPVPRARVGAAAAEQTARRFSRVQLEVQTEGQATGAQMLEELLQTVAAVALERAQARAAQRLVDTATDALCEHAERRETWRATCGVLEQLTPSTLGTASEALRQALSSDVARWIVTEARLSSAQDRDYLDDVIQQALTPVLRRPGDVSRADLLRIVNALVTREWESGNADVVNLAFFVVRACARQDDADCDVGGVVDAATPVVCKERPELCDVWNGQRLRIERLAAQLSVVIAQRGLKAAELRRALRDVVDTTLSLAEELHAEAPPRREPSTVLPAAVLQLQSARHLLLAMLADDAFSLTLGLGQLVEGEPLSPRVRALLNALLAYARTYERQAPDGLEPAERRKQVIETLMNAATDRSQRQDDWIASVGVNVGFEATGYQSIDGDGQSFTPQLSLPLGIFLQRGPDRCTPGFHAGAFLADVAQYASYQSDGTTADPRWDSAVALGAQLGIVLGSIADPFVIGLDARYAPTLFSTAKSSEPAAGGTLRLGVFASYYVPFFDLN